MNSKITDRALDLGVFALDNEIENSSIPNMYPISGTSWNSPPAPDRINTECFVVA